MKQHTTIWIDTVDRSAIAVIRERYGCSTDSDAIRLALRILAESSRVDIQQSEQRQEEEPHHGTHRDERR